jgi:hypothetical protein
VEEEATLAVRERIKRPVGHRAVAEIFTFFLREFVAQCGPLSAQSKGVELLTLEAE